MSRFLILEDSVDDQELYKEVLGSSHDYMFYDRVDGFLETARFYGPDLIILDVELAKGNGFQALTQLIACEETAIIPVFIVSAQVDTNNKVMGITLGADDYITKPYDPNEFKAKVQTKLKKIATLVKNRKVTCGDISLSLDDQKVTILVNGESQKIDLTTLDFKLLKYFMENTNCVISREALLDAVWGKDVSVSDRNIDTHLSILRKKLGPCSHYIETQYGAGYMFSAANFKK